MERHSPQGVKTRSKTALLKESMLVAPSKLSGSQITTGLQPAVPGGCHGQTETVRSFDSASFNTYRDPSIDSQRDGSPKSQTVNKPLVPAPSDPRFLKDQSAQTCPIIRDLVVCCSSCRVIFQQQANCSTFACPVCSQQKSDKQWLEVALTEFRSTNAQIADRLAELDKALVILQTEVTSIKNAGQNDALAISKSPAENLDRANTGGETNRLEEQMDTDNALISETGSCLNVNRNQLDEVRERLESLVDASKTKANQLEELCSRAECYLTKMDSNTNPKLSENNASHSEADAEECVQPTNESHAKSAIIVGGSNVVRFSKLALSLLHRDARFRVIGDISFTITESTDFCRKWLHDIKGPALIVLHSGLQDILSHPLDQPDYKLLIENICDSVRALHADCVDFGALLKVCSVPEVVDFINRHDYRKIAFDLNAALNNLALELGFQFINNAAVTPSLAHLTTYDGRHFNKAGQFAVLKPIVTTVAEWLEIEPDWSVERKALPQGTQALSVRRAPREDSYRHKKFFSVSRRNPSNLPRDFQDQPRVNRANPPVTRAAPRYSGSLRRGDNNEYLEWRAGHQNTTGISYRRSDVARRVHFGLNTRRAKFVSHPGSSAYVPWAHTREHSSAVPLNPWQPGFEPYRV